MQYFLWGCSHRASRWPGLLVTTYPPPPPLLPSPRSLPLSQKSRSLSETASTLKSEKSVLTHQLPVRECNNITSKELRNRRSKLHHWFDMHPLWTTHKGVKICILGLCFMWWYLIETNCYSLIYSSLKLF